jgi:hypothetical protein
MCQRVCVCLCVCTCSWLRFKKDKMVSLCANPDLPYFNMDKEGPKLLPVLVHNFLARKLPKRKVKPDEEGSNETLAMEVEEGVIGLGEEEDIRPHVLKRPSR